MPTLQRVLIANRGEIAVRIARAVSAVGATSVTVYAADEPKAVHVRAGDESVALPGSGPAGYLDLAAVVTAAVEHGCDGLHPGYGFLSEDPRLAAACRDAGIAFVGPSPDTLDRFGDKVAARSLAERVGVPVPAGTEVDPDAAVVSALAERVGDVVIKAVAGGGGRGQRQLSGDADTATIDAALAAARREANAAFGDGRVYAEERILGARHVEVQVVGDGTRVEHLWERDCTVQRRGQKLLEFAPAIWTDDATRLRLRDAAVAVAEAADLRSLATVEFLVVGDRFVFLEANPRLQVEHTVTEEVTGIDLVRMQLSLAGGASLAELGIFSAPEPAVYAVQCRLNAESLRSDGTLRSSTGTIDDVRWPAGYRVDHAVDSGMAVTGRYDSLLAKVVVTAATPADLVGRAADALRDTTIAGVDTNRDLLIELLEHPALTDGRITVDWLTEHASELESTESAAATTSEPSGAAGDDEVVAPMAAIVLSVEVATGDTVVAGQPVAVVEAMKMEHVITAPHDGRVLALPVTGGDAVAEGDVLLRIEPSGADADGGVGDGAGDGERGHAGSSRLVGGVADDVDVDAIRDDLALSLQRHAPGLDENRPEAVAKRHRRGHRTARENLADLLDDDSFLEYGALAIAAQRSRRDVDDLRATTPADGMVGGLGTVNGQPVAVASYDYMVLAGTQGFYNHHKKDRLIEVALDRRLPFVFFTEGGGGRPGDTDTPWVAGLHCRAFEWFAQLAEAVPTIAVVNGRCFAGNAAIAGMCDVIIATDGANLGMGGPAMIEGGGLGVFAPDDVGPMDDQRDNGVVDMLVADEAAAVAAAIRYLDLLHRPVAVDVPAANDPAANDPAANDPAGDDRVLRHLVPENRRRVYDMRAIVDAVADPDTVLELQPDYGRAVITARARVHGHAVGVIANDPEHVAGAIDTDAARKLTGFVRRCNADGLPIVSLCDTPGFMVGPDEERRGLVRAAGELFRVGAARTVPLFMVVTRRGYGLGAQAMAGGSFHAPTFTVSWPSGEFGGMGLEGAVRLGFRKELEATPEGPERDELFQRLLDRMYDRGRAVHMAEAFEIDAVIDPADTRRWLRGGLRSDGGVSRSPS